MYREILTRGKRDLLCAVDIVPDMTVNMFRLTACEIESYLSMCCYLFPDIKVDEESILVKVNFDFSAEKNVVYSGGGIVKFKDNDEWFMLPELLPLELFKKHVDDDVIQIRTKVGKLYLKKSWKFSDAYWEVIDQGPKCKLNDEQLYIEVVKGKYAKLILGDRNDGPCKYIVDPSPRVKKTETYMDGIVQLMNNHIYHREPEGSQIRTAFREIIKPLNELHYAVYPDKLYVRMVIDNKKYSYNIRDLCTSDPWFTNLIKFMDVLMDTVE
jgi:hypothetical protein